MIVNRRDFKLIFENEFGCASMLFSNEITNKFDLQKLLYYDVKEDFKLVNG